MKSKALGDILTKHGQCTLNGDKIDVPEAASVTLFASIGSESLVVAQVLSIQLLDDLVYATTQKGESYAVLAEDVRAVRFGKIQKKRTGLV